MGITAKLTSSKRSLSVGLVQSSNPLSIKGTAKVTRLSQLSDVNDELTSEGGQSGSSIIFDAENNTYVLKKLVDYDGEEITYQGGEF